MIEAYLARLGLPRAAPGVDYLFTLHRAHVSRVTYSNLQIMRGTPAAIDPEVSAGEVIAGRGGYCFHLNGAFSWLLRELGFQVTLHRGYVQRLVQIGEPQLNHLVLVVHNVQGGPWFVDAGLGDAIHEPLPLAAGRYAQGPFRYEFGPASGRDGWRFTHDPLGSFDLMEFESARATIDDFRAAHTHLSTSPESNFVKFLTAQVRRADGVQALRGCVLTVVDAAGRHVRHIEEPDEWVSTLVGLGLTDDGLASLWPSERATHEAWLASTS
jgi:N-hydroxyarylamine O-acetyltransferase